VLAAAEGQRGFGAVDPERGRLRMRTRITADRRQHDQSRVVAPDDTTAEFDGLQRTSRRHLVHRLPASGFDRRLTGDWWTAIINPIL
jgi:hypothetical protein